MRKSWNRSDVNPVISHAIRQSACSKRSDCQIIAPSTECLSPITEELIRKGLEKEYDVDLSRRPRATPLCTQATHSSSKRALPTEGVAKGRKDGHPAIRESGSFTVSTRWVREYSRRRKDQLENYELLQPGGAHSPRPVVILTHVASTNVPFTSESKEAIADIPR